RVLKRAKELINTGVDLKTSDPLQFFLKNDISLQDFNEPILNVFSELDDFDVIASLKVWQHHEDFVLRHLCSMILNRSLLKIKLKDKKPKQETLKHHLNLLISHHNICKTEAQYFVFSGQISNQAYQLKTQSINILYKSGKIEDIAKASDQFNVKALAKPVTKYYICYPKDKL
ncbi:MAG: phosphohydrolase, partial [Flavobacteriaceae bacterium CG_4_10_14_3_um_filter_33_47]